MKRLQYGLTLDGVKLKPAQVSWQNEHQLRFVLRQGRKRQIRRMCELVGLFVTGLKRVPQRQRTVGRATGGQVAVLAAGREFLRAARSRYWRHQPR
jgi:23S rRNA pseudouridine2604 synthase